MDIDRGEELPELEALVLGETCIGYDYTPLERSLVRPFKAGWRKSWISIGGMRGETWKKDHN